MRLLDYLADHRGIATSDVRSIKQYANRDVYQVRLWNHRRIDVTSLELFNALSLRGKGSNLRPSA